jgi:hypothetical protein
MPREAADYGIEPGAKGLLSFVSIALTGVSEIISFHSAISFDISKLPNHSS